MAKFSEQRRCVLRVIQPSTRSTLGEYDSRPPLARYVWYVTWYLHSSCCSETHVRPSFLPVFLPLSTLDVTHVRRCTRPSPLYRTKQRRKAGRGTGYEARNGIRAQEQPNLLQNASLSVWNRNWNIRIHSALHYSCCVTCLSPMRSKVMCMFKLSQQMHIASVGYSETLRHAHLDQQ